MRRARSNFLDAFGATGKRVAVSDRCLAVCLREVDPGRTLRALIAFRAILERERRSARFLRARKTPCYVEGMSNRYQLVGLKNEELLDGVSRLVAQVNELTADVLAHLVEVESRMLHAELGFPNLFSYCVASLGLSEGAAGRRCLAARLCQRFPESFDLLARGELHLSALCGLAAYLNPDNAAALFAACRRKTRRQVDEILASRFPTPDAKESMRRLPNRPVPVPVPAPALAPASASVPIPPGKGGSAGSSAWRSEANAGLGRSGVSSATPSEEAFHQGRRAAHRA